MLDFKEKGKYEVARDGKGLDCKSNIKMEHFKGGENMRLQGD